MTGALSIDQVLHGRGVPRTAAMTMCGLLSEPHNERSEKVARQGGLRN